ncbi:hypothetical protein D9M68_456990 [compost metagenome]
MPGITASASSILSIISCREDAETHSFLGFIDNSISPFSIGIGSVGISALPIRVTACLISGNLSFNIFSALLKVLTTSVSEAPCIIDISMAKSPSSRVGINSPPIFEKTQIVIANKIKTKLTKATLIFKTLTNTC